jgi:hypothetical protein
MPPEIPLPQGTSYESTPLPHTAPRTAARLYGAVGLIVELIPECDHAGVIATSHGQLSIIAGSDPVVDQGDDWQLELNQGPGLDAVRDEHLVMSPDLADERRWTLWTPKVVTGLNVHAMMSIQLCNESTCIGALNLYSDRSMGWSQRQVAVAQALAGQLAVAVADAVEIDIRREAMTSRMVIGDAEGILMERFGLTRDRAFNHLRHVSHMTNRKLVSIAEDLVHTGRLPEFTDSGGQWTSPNLPDFPPTRASLPARW